MLDWDSANGGILLLDFPSTICRELLGCWRIREGLHFIYPDRKSSKPREKMVRWQAAKIRGWSFWKSTINQSRQGDHVSQTPALESPEGAGLDGRRPPLSQPVCYREDQRVGCPLPPRKLSCCLMRFNSPSKGGPGPNICLIKGVRVLETQKLLLAPPFSGLYHSQNPFH